MSARVGDQRLLAVLGQGIVAIDSPVLRADDLGALRGDGIFETMHIRSGQPWLIDEHLARLAVSAGKLGLTLPPRSDLVALASLLLDAWPSTVEGALRLVCTRGPETGGAATVYATATPIAASSIAARNDGVRVLTASLGFAADARSNAPWLLAGAKTLSYAVNMASQRWALENGADDVLWVSGDGYALEAPTSSLVWLNGSTLWTVPAERTGILPSTTVGWLFDHVNEIGLDAGERMITPPELADADGVWLASSVRGAAEVTSIDGVARSRCSTTAVLSKLLGFEYQPAAQPND